MTNGPRAGSWRGLRQQPLPAAGWHLRARQRLRTAIPVPAGAFAQVLLFTAIAAPPNTVLLPRDGLSPLAFSETLWAGHVGHVHTPLKEEKLCKPFSAWGSRWESRRDLCYRYYQPYPS